MKSQILSDIKFLSKRLSVIIAGVLLMIGSFLANTQAVAAETYTVKMGSDSGQLVFEPKELKIKSGDTVKWLNNKAFPHNVIFEGYPELSHKKLLLKPNLGAESTFTAVGEYRYFCTPHRGAGMVGKVIVEG